MAAAHCSAHSSRPPHDDCPICQLLCSHNVVDERYCTGPHAPWAELCSWHNIRASSTGLTAQMAGKLKDNLLLTWAWYKPASRTTQPPPFRTACSTLMSLRQGCLGVQQAQARLTVPASSAWEDRQ